MAIAVAGNQRVKSGNIFKYILYFICKGSFSIDDCCQGAGGTGEVGAGGGLNTTWPHLILNVANVRFEDT